MKEVRIMGHIWKGCSFLWGAVILIGLFGVGRSYGAAAPGLTRTHSGGGVTVKVTYLNPQGKDDARFQVVLDTHSGDLDVYDLKALSTLRDDSGREYQPAQVENKGSGHHREATLTFPKTASETKRPELVIKDVAGVKERVFRWGF
jgi:hypothetical protein